MTSPGDDSPWVDTHTHLDDPVFDADRDLVMDASRDAGVCHIINIGYAPERWESSRVLRETFSGVEIAIGLHPQQAAELDPALSIGLTSAIQELRPVAIAETGYDFSRRGPPPKTQERAFVTQLEMAAEAGLPVIIHQRDAAEALMVTLDRWQEPTPIVLHSFDGTPRLVDWAIERGCHFGIGGLATNPRSAPLRQLLSAVPLDRLLLETDSPYLSPPGAAAYRNTPANLPAIAGLLAPLWGLSAQELGRYTAQNATKLFGLTLGAQHARD